MEAKILQVGHLLYRQLNKKIVEEVQIERVTKTLAISGKYRFDRRFVGTARMVGWNVKEGIWLWHTHELENEFTKNELIDTIKGYNLNRFSIGHLKEIIKAINKKMAVGSKVRYTDDYKHTKQIVSFEVFVVSKIETVTVWRDTPYGTVPDGNTEIVTLTNGFQIPKSYLEIVEF